MTEITQGRQGPAARHSMYMMHALCLLPAVQEEMLLSWFLPHRENMNAKKTKSFEFRILTIQ